MSDPTNPIPSAPDAAPQHAPAAPHAEAPPPAAAPPPPRVLNPYAMQAPKPVAPIASAPPPAVPTAPEVPAAPTADPRVDALLGVLGETVAQDLGALPANVAAAVRAIAPDSDPVAQRRALNALRANGLAVPQTGAAPAPLAPPATTINAPPQITPEVRTQEGGDADTLRRYNELIANGSHYAAANFLLKHSAEITRAQSRVTH